MCQLIIITEVLLHHQSGATKSLELLLHKLSLVGMQLPEKYKENFDVSSESPLSGVTSGVTIVISELKQVTFLTTRTSTGSKVDVFHQSQSLTQSSDVTHAVRVVKNVTCLSSLITPDEGPSFETSKLSLYFSGSCIPTNISVLI